MNKALVLLGTALFLGACTSDQTPDELPTLVVNNAAGSSKAGSAAPVTDKPTGAFKGQSFSNSTARQVSRRELEAGNFYASLVAEAEGFRPNFYRDSRGFAIGWGYNASFQNAATSRAIGRDVLKDASRGEALAGVSGQFNLAQLPRVTVDLDEGMRMSEYIRPQYENPLAKWIPGYDRLLPHQKAVMAYHSYKTGSTGAMKFTGLKKAVEAMLANPTLENTQTAARHFEYKYTVAGEVKQDTRSKVFMQALFVDPLAYAALIQGKPYAPLVNVPEFKELALDASQPQTFSRIPDPIGELKLEMEHSGRSIEVQAFEPQAKRLTPTQYMRCRRSGKCPGSYANYQ